MLRTQIRKQIRTQILKLILIVSMLAAVPAIAVEKTIWECRTSNPQAEPILFLVEWGSRSYVKFSHMRFGAHYEVTDSYHGWYWHNDGSGYYRYGLVLGTDGKAWYHDFGAASGAEESKPLDHFSCRVSDGD